MEIKDLFKTVGSDPCLVLNLPSTASISGANLTLDSILFESSDSDEQLEFQAKFINMFSELIKTKVVTARFYVVENTTAIPALDNLIVTHSGSWIIEQSPSLAGAGLAAMGGNNVNYRLGIVRTAYYVSLQLTIVMSE